MRLLTAFPYKERVGGDKRRRGRRKAAGESEREWGKRRGYYEGDIGGGEKFWTER